MYGEHHAGKGPTHREKSITLNEWDDNYDRAMRKSNKNKKNIIEKIIKTSAKTIYKYK